MQAQVEGAPARDVEAIMAAGAAQFWQKAATAPAWYVVEAIDGKEFDLALALSAAFALCSDFEALHLVDERVTHRRIVAHGQVQKARLIRKFSRFGPLIFVRARLTKGLVTAISNMPQALAMLRAHDGERPVVIPDELIEFYRKSVSRGDVSKSCDFAPNDRIRIIAGPFSGIEGVVRKVYKGAALWIDTTVFGGTAPVYIEAVHVELVERGQRPPQASTSSAKAKRKFG